MEANNSTETVFWVNRFSEHTIRKVLEGFRILEPSKKQSMTILSATKIDELEDQQLRESLKRQLQDVREGALVMELPVAHMPHKRFSHSYSVSTKSSSGTVQERMTSS